MAEINFIQAIGALGAFVNELEKMAGPENDGKVELLTAAKLAELKHMNTWQLDAIYHHGKKKTRIDDDPAAYRELRGMNTWQLEAIFGDEPEEDK